MLSLVTALKKKSRQAESHNLITNAAGRSVTSRSTTAKTSEAFCKTTGESNDIFHLEACSKLIS